MVGNDAKQSDTPGMCEETRLHLLVVVQVDWCDQVAADGVPRMLTIEQLRRCRSTENNERGVHGLLHGQHHWRLTFLQVDRHARPDHVWRVVRQLPTRCSSMMSRCN